MKSKNKVDVASFAIAMKHNLKNVALVQELFHQMEEKGFPNTVAYTTLLESLGKAGEVQLMIQHFERMLRRGIAPARVTFNILMSVFSTVGECLFI